MSYKNYVCTECGVTFKKMTYITRIMCANCKKRYYKSKEYYDLKRAERKKNRGISYKEIEAKIFNGEEKYGESSTRRD